VCDLEMSTIRPPRHVWGVAPEGEKNWVQVMVENTFKSHGERSELDMGWFNTFQRTERGVSRTVRPHVVRVMTHCVTKLDSFIFLAVRK